jgi:hypothetical protein
VISAIKSYGSVAGRDSNMADIKRNPNSLPNGPAQPRKKPSDILPASAPAFVSIFLINLLAAGFHGIGKNGVTF